jgi:hypothetical protein
MQGYLVTWKGQKMKVNANSAKQAAYLRLVDVAMPRSGCVTVCHQETEDGEVTADIFYLADRKCRICGCTERRPCGTGIALHVGCAWVDWDLCSACVPKVAA